MILGPWGTPGEVILEALDLFVGFWAIWGTPDSTQTKKACFLTPELGEKVVPKSMIFYKIVNFW